MLLPEIQAGYYYLCSAWVLMGLSRIHFYSLFIFISVLDDITDDTVTKLANDRGWKRLQALRKAGLRLRLTLAHCIAALHKMKFSTKGSKAFLLVGQNQLCKMGNSDLGRCVC